MAYAAVAYLKQLMDEEILPYLQLVVRLKQLRAIDFYVKARYNPLYCSNKFLILDDPSLPDHSYQKKHMERWLKGRVWEGLLTDIDSTLDDLDGVNLRLKDFVQKLDSGAISQVPLSTSPEQWEVANDMLSFNLEVKEVLTFYKQASSVSISFLQRVDTFLEECKNDDTVKRFKVVVDIAANSIEDLTDRNPSKDSVKIQRICDLLNHANQSLDESVEEPSSSKTCREDKYMEENMDRLTEQTMEKGSSSQGERVHDSGTEGANLSRTPETEAKEFCHDLEKLAVAESIENFMVGMGDYFSTIIDELTRPPKGLTVVRIVGMGGIGKTTLAKKVFHHPSIVRYFHCLAWVNAGSNVQQVLSDLLYAIRLPNHVSMGEKGDALRKCLKGKRYLIIVDGLWDFQAWNNIKNFFPDDATGSRILITSRVPTSGTDVLNNPPHCFGMRPLNEAESWELLEKKLFGKQRCPTELEGVGKQISEKCGGLPLAIVLIAGALLNLPRSYISWLSVLDNIPAIVWANPESCLDIVALSYKYLPHHLKPCFLLVGAFPSKYDIGYERLVKLFMADRFFQHNYNNPENDAENCLKELISRSLVLVSRISLDGRVKTCRVHDMVRQLCLREAQKEKFMHVTEGNGGVNATVRLEEQRHLIFIVDDCAKVGGLPPIPRLRSYIWLTMGSNFTPGMVLHHLLDSKWIRVLDVYFLPFREFPRQIARLVNLRYLALNVKVITSIDHYLGRLWKLQSLIVYGPWILRDIEENPTLQLKYMRRVSHIDFMVPVCLDSSDMIYNLKSLSSVTFSSPMLSSKMHKLRKLGISEIKPDYEQGAASNCFKNWSMDTLETLKCCFYRGNKEARNLDLCYFPPYLKKLTLSWCCSSWEHVNDLSNLQNLETLKLKNNAIGGSKWVVAKEAVFYSLKQLLIDKSDLVHWEAESNNHFPSLERLVLRYCNSLAEIPVGVLSTLESIELHTCCKSAEDSARDFEALYDTPKVVIQSGSARM